MDTKLLTAFVFCFSQLIFSQTPISTATTDVVTFVATESDGSTFTTSRPLNESATFTTNTQWNQTIYNNGTTNSVGRITVKKQWSRHQKNDLAFTASSGGIITIKMKFRLIGSLLAAGNNLCYLGLVDYLDSSNTGDPTNSPEEGEYIVLSIDDGDTSDALSGVGYGNRHLFMRYKTNGQTQVLADDTVGYLTVKYFIGQDMGDSNIKTKLEYGNADSGWRNHGWTSQRLYDTLTQTGSPTNSDGAYMIFSGREALTSSNANTSQMYIDQYDFTYNDSGVVMIANNAINYNSTSSTGTKPGSSDRVYIFDKNVTYSGSANQTYDYLFIDEQGSFSFTPSSAKSLTITNNIELGGELTLGTVTNFSATNFDIENGATFDITAADALSVDNFNIKTGGTATITSATSLTSADLDVDGSLTITTTGDISATDLDMSGTVDIGGTNDLTLDNLNISSGGSLTVTRLENGSIKNLVLNGTIDFEESGFKEGLVKVSSNSSFNNASATSSFDSNMTLTDSGTSANNLTVAPGGFLLRHNSRIIHWDSAAKWKTYNGSSWTQPAAADDGSLTGLDRTTDYSNVNLFYNSSSYSTNQINNILEGTDPSTEPARDLFTFNDIRIFDGKVMVLNGCRVAAQNIYVEDSTDPNSIVSYGGNLKVENSFSGNIQYNKNVSETDQWYLISGPVAGASIDDFVTNEDLQAGTGNNIAFATFENDDAAYGGTQADAANGWWSYYDGSSSFGNFVPGKGYAVKRNDSSTDDTFTYTGTMNDGNVNIAINKVTTGLNLVGNPYLAAININENANATDNLLELNTSILEEETAWFWNGNTNSSGAYTAVNQVSDAKYAAPMSGFFVRSNDAGGSFSFTNAIQTTSVGGAFNRANVYPKINLSISDGNAVQNTQIFYVQDATTGWDNGYDSTTFESSGFQIFTKHADNSTNQNLAIQSLPQDNYDNMIIPVGVNASAGTEITIAAEFENLPAGINVYLEDALDNRFTLLDENNDFSEILNSDENGTGRFYLHTMSNSLGENEFNHSDLIIYASSRNNLRIFGLENQNANVEMFDMMGKRVLKTSFIGAGVNNINLPNLNKGVYIVKVVSEIGITNKKLIIQ